MASLFVPKWELRQLESLSKGVLNVSKTKEQKKSVLSSDIEFVFNFMSWSLQQFVHCINSILPVPVLSGSRHLEEKPFFLLATVQGATPEGVVKATPEGVVKENEQNFFVERTGDSRAVKVKTSVVWSRRKAPASTSWGQGVSWQQRIETKWYMYHHSQAHSLNVRKGKRQMIFLLGSFNHLCTITRTKTKQLIKNLHILKQNKCSPCGQQYGGFSNNRK